MMKIFVFAKKFSEWYKHVEARYVCAYKKKFDFFGQNCILGLLETKQNPKIHFSTVHGSRMGGIKHWGMSSQMKDHRTLNTLRDQPSRITLLKYVFSSDRSSLRDDALNR